jgi:hypothetical protein
MISPTRLLRLATRFAAWVTPHVKEWHRKRHQDRIEGERHLTAKNYSEAEKHLIAAVALAERRRVPASKLNALRLQLAQAQREQRKWTEAESSAQAAIETAGRDSSLRGAALEALADIHIAHGDYASAQSSIREAVECAGEHGELARRTHKLAKACYGAGERDEALNLYGQAIELHEQAFGEDHAATADFLGELGALERTNGRHAEAQLHLRRALKIHESSLGADSHQATEDLSQLASSLEESGDLEGALAEYERVLRRKERQVGGNMEHLADMQARVARIYLNWGQRGKARELLVQALPPLTRKPGRRLATALETMAELEELSGRLQEAARLREQALSAAAAELPA